MSAINEVLLMRTANLYKEIHSEYKAKKISQELYYDFIRYINELGFTTTKLIEYENSNK